jgi:uncharacterized protein YjhX (UPF0386 family)
MIKQADIVHVLSQHMRIEHERDEFSGNDHPYVDGHDSAAEELWEMFRDSDQAVVEQLKQEVINSLLRENTNPDEVYLVSGQKSWTRRQLADEIQQNTPTGVGMLSKMLNLTLYLMTRGSLDSDDPFERLVDEKIKFYAKELVKLGNANCFNTETYRRFDDKLMLLMELRNKYNEQQKQFAAAANGEN